MTTIASLFNFDGSDYMIVFGIVLLLFGTKHLPELARGALQALRDFFDPDA